MTDETVTLRFVVPDNSAPGFLRRQRQALEFREKMTGETSPETLDELVVYLAQFVTEPEDDAAKADALWMASQDEFMALLNALTGGDENPTP